MISYLSSYCICDLLKARFPIAYCWPEYVLSKYCTVGANMASTFLVTQRCDKCGKATELTQRFTLQELCRDCSPDLSQDAVHDTGPPEWVCKDHSTQRVEIFCKTCQCGCCRECAEEVHIGHDVICVLEYAADIRLDLLEQLQTITVKEQKLTQLQDKLQGCAEKKDLAFRESNWVVHGVANEIKRKITEKLEKEYDRMIRFKCHALTKEEKKVTLLREAKTALDNIQRIDEIKRDMHSILSIDEEPRNREIEKARRDLQDEYSNCKCTKDGIKSLLDSTPKNLVLHGGPLRSACKMAKPPLAVQCEETVEKCCSSVVQDLPKLNERDQARYFFDGRRRPCSPFWRWMYSIMIILLFAHVARREFLDLYNCFLSSESVIEKVKTLLCFYLCYVPKCVTLASVLNSAPRIDYPFALHMSLKRQLHAIMRLIFVGLTFEMYNFAFLTFVSLPLVILRFTTVSADVVSLFSILQSCLFIYCLRLSKTFEKFWDHNVSMMFM